MMRNYLSIRLLLTIIPFVLIGCKEGEEYLNYGTKDMPSPRLIVRGKVTNAADEPLQGIYVSIFDVREATEPDILTYNYAITGLVGKYSIIRYRGRECPTVITVVATDSTGIYEEQLVTAPVTYDYIQTSSGKMPHDAFVTADFVLSQQNSQ